MSVIQSIKKTRYPISESTKKICAYLGTYLPKLVPEDLSFYLLNSKVSVASAIRRCVNSELPVQILTFESKNFYTNDHIHEHHIRKIINLVPIRQISGMKFNLNVSNRTDVLMPIYMNMLVPERKGDTEEMFPQYLEIAVLRPGKVLKISNIHTVEGVSYLNDNVAFSYPGNVGYKCLQLKKYKKERKEVLAEMKDKKMKERYLKEWKELETLDDDSQNSMTTEQKDFKITIPRQKYISPVVILKNCFDVLMRKFERLEGYLKQIKEGVDFHSENLHVVFADRGTTLTISNETETVGNLLVDFMFDHKEDIKKSNCYTKHPDSTDIIVFVSEASLDLLRTATRNIIAEVRNIKSYF